MYPDVVMRTAENTFHLESIPSGGNTGVNAQAIIFRLGAALLPFIAMVCFSPAEYMASICC